MRKNKVRRFPNKGTRKWETVYVAVPNINPEEETPLVAVNIMEEKLGDAIKEAKLFTQKHPDVTLNINIGKRLIGEKYICAQISCHG